MIRRMRDGDQDAVLDLLTQLAEYEKLLDRFHITRDVLTRDYLGEHPIVQCDILMEGSRAAGMASWYWTYSSFAAARGIFLEDLFVLPEFRGRGHGRALLAHIARIAVQANVTRVEWNVLPWNKPSIEFYESLGADQMEDWLVFRLSGEALQKLGA